VVKTKISVVRYLNSVPLVWGILEGPQKDDFEAVFSTPAECAAQLASGEVDLGLIPSIEYQRIPGSRIVAGPAIAARRRVLSVILLSLVPLFRIQSVSYDNASRTSVSLARVLLNEFYGNKPEFRSLEPDLKSMLADSDAALLIGDTALRYQFENGLPSAHKQAEFVREGVEPIQVFDLMERWNNLTGLPFVFAFWAGRDGFADPTVTKKLIDSRNFGLAHLETIAERYEEKLNLDAAFLLGYLKDNMDYHMDSEGVEALHQFYRMSKRAGVLKSVRGIEFL
jgi:chorismate dehydratase